MKPKNSEQDTPQSELFQTRLESFLNLKHPLVRLSETIDWEFFEKEFGAAFNDRGRPALPTRLMVALTYLKHTYDLSDEELVWQFLENGYWQYFCGYEYFQHEFPCDSSSMTRWRKRLGEKGAEKLLSETLRAAHERGLLKKAHLGQVIVDTTVQEKNIAFPTDAKLCAKAAEVLVKQAEVHGIILRQKYPRVLKHLQAKYSRYAHARQYRRARAALKKIKTILGRIVRDIERKSADLPQGFIEKMNIARTLLEQKRESTNKIYSIHEPAVECISKGKAHKKYEFGCKAGVVTTVKSNFVIGAMALHGRPYDGHTLIPAIEQAERLTGRKIEDIFVDKGYRGSDHHPVGKRVYISGRKHLSRRLKKLLRRRSAIEPVIGHMKSDHRLSRNLLKGIEGDKFNPILAAAAFNMRKILVSFFLFLAWLSQKTKMESQIALSIPA